MTLMFTIKVIRLLFPPPEPALSLHHEKSFIQGAFWTGITARGRLSLVIQTGRSVYQPGARFS